MSASLFSFSVFSVLCWLVCVRLIGRFFLRMLRVCVCVYVYVLSLPLSLSLSISLLY